MVAACRGVAEARRDSGREARFRASGGHSVRGEELDPMKKFMTGLAIAAIASSALVGIVSAQDENDRADSGNGGVSTANSNGGAVGVGDANNGGNSGSSTAAGDSSGSTLVLGGAADGDLAATMIAAILANLGLE